MKKVFNDNWAHLIPNKVKAKSSRKIDFIPIRIDEKTVVLAKKGSNIQAIKDKYLTHAKAWISGFKKNISNE